MKTAEEPAPNLGQTLEWLRKELVRLRIFYLMPPPQIPQGLPVPPSQVPHWLGQRLQAGAWALQAPLWDQPCRAQLPSQVQG